MLQYTEFKEELVKQISDKVGELGLSNIEINTNFEPTPEGIQERLNLKRIGSNIALSIRLEDVFKDYSHGVPLEKIAEMLGDNIERQLHEADQVEGITEKIKDYEWVKDHLVLYALPFYSETKKDFVTTRVGCVDIGVRVCVHEDENSIGTFAITNDILKHMGISKDTLFEDARANSQAKRKIEFSKLSEAAKDEEPEVDLPAYLASVDKGVSGIGGGILAYDNFIPEAQEVLGCKSFYIIPSSIRELILFPKEFGDRNPQELNIMLMFANETVVRHEEVLAQNVMLYNEDTEELEIVENKFEG